MRTSPLTGSTGDEKKPECENCRALEITCFFGEEKPDWFDGGPKQKAEMERVKTEIRVKAGQRRDRKYQDLLEKGDPAEDASQPDSHSQHEAHPSTEVTMSGTSESEARHSSTGLESTPASSLAHSPAMFHNRTGFLSDDVRDVDLHFIMMYLDSIFPYLFPFYHSSPLSGGRGWILESLVANKSVHHAAVSLATFFFGILLSANEVPNPEDHSACIENISDRLQAQLELGLTELRREMEALSTQSPGAGNREALICMQSIILLCYFEVATSNASRWMVHLDAAITLLEVQLIPSPESWPCTLTSFDSGQWTAAGLQRPFTTYQQALRFYTAQCLYMDLIASISLERVPRLYPYQSTVMPGCAGKPKNVESIRPAVLYLDDFVGLHNSLVQILSDVVSLDAWKKEQRKNGSLSVHQLIAKAEPLGAALSVMIPSIVNVANGTFEEAAAMFPPHYDPLKSLQPESPESLPGNPRHNLIWLYATQTYLHVVVNGWQPSCPEISCNVQKMTALFQSIPAGTPLRTLALPMCIAGCLSPADQEDTYRNMIASLGSLQAFGTLKDAKQVMEAVWSNRSLIDENWDISKCLNILGHPVLLV